MDGVTLSDGEGRENAHSAALPAWFSRQTCAAVTLQNGLFCGAAGKGPGRRLSLFR